MDRLFVDGELYSTALKTDGGWLAFLADVSIAGTELTLSNLAIEPLQRNDLRRVWATRRMRTAVLGQARNEGYTAAVIEGMRKKAGKRNRPLLRRGVIR